MRLTFDTTIFVNALINEEYKKAVDNFINKHNSFLPISLDNEIQRVILKIHTILVKISVAYFGGDNPSPQEYLNEPDLLELKKDFDNLYKVLEKLKNDPKIEEKVEIINDITTSILAELHKVRIYPNSEDGIDPILQMMNSKIELLNQKINNKTDIKHLIFAEAFAELFADDETYFITDDYKDIINNKRDIEDILNYVKVFDFKGSPVSLL